MFTNDKKKKKWKKILGITTGIGLALVAGVGIGFSSYYVSQNSFVADDLSEGRSIKLDFNLVDANNEFVLDVAKEEGLLKESSDFLVSTLEDKGLTNISVSYGFEFREIPKSSLITLELTSNAFDFGKGLNLHDIVDNNSFYKKQVQEIRSDINANDYKAFTFGIEPIWWRNRGIKYEIGNSRIIETRYVDYVEVKTVTLLKIDGNAVFVNGVKYTVLEPEGVYNACVYEETW